MTDTTRSPGVGVAMATSTPEKGPVHASLDDLVIALYLYVTIDDWLGPRPQSRPSRPQAPRLSDAELVCLAVDQVLLGSPSEHHWRKVCYARLGHLFPCLPNQPGYHQRRNGARWLLSAALAHLAAGIPWTPDTLRLLDATPIPRVASRGDRQALGTSHSRWYWGLEAVPAHHH